MSRRRRPFPRCPRPDALVPTPSGAPPDPRPPAQALLAEMCIPVTKQKLKALMRDMDSDGSGEVDFEEVRPARPPLCPLVTRPRRSSPSGRVPLSRGPSFDRSIGATRPPPLPRLTVSSTSWWRRPPLAPRGRKRVPRSHLWPEPDLVSSTEGRLTARGPWYRRRGSAAARTAYEEEAAADPHGSAE